MRIKIDPEIPGCFHAFSPDTTKVTEKGHIRSSRPHKANDLGLVRIYLKQFPAEEVTAGVDLDLEPSLGERHLCHIVSIY
jgi:hypothetical protein